MKSEKEIKTTILIYQKYVKTLEQHLLGLEHNNKNDLETEFEILEEKINIHTYQEIIKVLLGIIGVWQCKNYDGEPIGDFESTSCKNCRKMNSCSYYTENYEI